MAASEVNNNIGAREAARFIGTEEEREELVFKIEKISWLPIASTTLWNFFLPSDYVAKSSAFMVRCSGEKVKKFANAFLTAALIICVWESLKSLYGRVSAGRKSDQLKLSGIPAEIKALKLKLEGASAKVQGLEVKFDALKTKIKGQEDQVEKKVLDDQSAFRRLYDELKILHEGFDKSAYSEEMAADYIIELEELVSEVNCLTILYKELEDLENYKIRSIAALYFDHLYYEIGLGLVLVPVVSKLDGLLSGGISAIPSYSNYKASPQYYATYASIMIMKNPLNTTFDCDTDNPVMPTTKKVVSVIAASLFWVMAQDTLYMHAATLLKNVKK
jgi:hypothetical protein